MHTWVANQTVWKAEGLKNKGLLLRGYLMSRLMKLIENFKIVNEKDFKHFK